MYNLDFDFAVIIFCIYDCCSRVFLSDEFLEFGLDVCREIVLVVVVGIDVHHCLDEGSFFRIIQVRFLFDIAGTCLDLDDIEGLHAVSLELVDVIHFPVSIFTCLESCLYGFRKFIVRNLAFGHAPLS